MLEINSRIKWIGLYIGKKSETLFYVMSCYLRCFYEACTY